MEAQPMRLQDLRLKEGMSLEQLAELSGVDHDRLVMFENNPETIRNMHLDTARQIAKALHCNVLELHPDEGWRGGIHCAAKRHSSDSRLYAKRVVRDDRDSPAEHLLV